MYGRNMTLHVGRAHARPQIPRVLELMAREELRPLALSTHVASFEEAPAVLAEHFRGGVIKTILVDQASR